VQVEDVAFANIDEKANGTTASGNEGQYKDKKVVNGLLGHVL